MSFSQCPECGETNFAEDIIQRRTFDCGFVGQQDTRTARCGRKNKRGYAASAAPVINDEAARYRLALLDAALISDTIAADMAARGHDGEFASRCRELAHQMRAFAGHSATVHSTHKKTGTALMTFVRKLRGGR